MKRRATQALRCVALAVAALASPRAAWAGDGNPRLQLMFDTSLVSYRTLHQTFDDSSDSLADVQRVNSGTASLDLLGGELGLGVGYLVTEHCLVGVRTQLAYGSNTNDLESSADRRMELGLLPRVEYVIGRAGVRPYVAAVAGVQRLSIEETRAGANSELFGTLFEAGGNLGVHAFIREGLSFDPSLTLTGYTGSLRRTSSLDRSTEVDIDASGLRCLVSLGFSGWL